MFEIGWFRFCPRSRPSSTLYDPAELTEKIYLYGYLNRIASSRRLGREGQRNMELIWLAGRLDKLLQRGR